MPRAPPVPGTCGIAVVNRVVSRAQPARAACTCGHLRRASSLSSHPAIRPGRAGLHAVLDQVVRQLARRHRALARDDVLVVIRDEDERVRLERNYARSALRRGQGRRRARDKRRGQVSGGRAQLRGGVCARRSAGLSAAPVGLGLGAATLSAASKPDRRRWRGRAEFDRPGRAHGAHQREAAAHLFANDLLATFSPDEHELLARDEDARRLEALLLGEASDERDRLLRGDLRARPGTARVCPQREHA